MTTLASWVDAQNSTVAEVAARFGVHRVTLQRYIAGAAMPRRAVALRIEQITKGAVTVSDLARGAA